MSAMWKKQMGALSEPARVRESAVREALRRDLGIALLGLTYVSVRVSFTSLYRDLHRPHLE